MDWNFASPFALLLLASGGVSLVLTVYAWQRRKMVGVSIFALLMIAVTVWSWGYALEIAAVSLPAKLFWAKVQYLSIVTLPLIWLVFALQYTHREKWLTCRNVAWLTIVPAITLLLVWTNQVHRLVWRSIGLIETAQGLMLKLTYGSWFWVNWGFSFLLLLLGSVLLILTLIQRPHLYRRQAGALLVASLVPWAGNFLYISDLNPVSPLDLTPIAFTFTGLALAWALFRFHLLDIVPVAHKAIMEHITTGIIVLDTQDRIIDLNPIAQRLLNQSLASAIGQPLVRFLGKQADLVERFRDTTEARTEITVSIEGMERRYELSISPLTDRHGHLTGRLIALHNVTERVQAEKALQQAHDDLSRRNQQLTQIAGENAQLYQQVQQHSQTLEHLVTERTAELRRSQERTRLIIDNALDAIITTDANGMITDWNAQAETVFGWPRQEIIGQTLTNTIIPLQHRVLHEQGVQHFLDTGELGTFNERVKVTAMHPEGYEFPVEMTVVPVKWGEEISFSIFAHDITKRVQSERILAQRTLEAEALHRFAKLINSSLDTIDVLTTLIIETGHILQVDACSIILVDEATQELVFRASTDSLKVEDTGEYLRMPLDQGIAGRVVRLGLPQIIDRIEDDPDYYRDIADSVQMSITSMLAVPMLYENTVVGVIEAISMKPHNFTSDEVRLLEGIAQSTLAAFHNSRLYETARQQAQTLRRLYDVGRSLTRYLDLETTLQKIIEGAAAMLDIPVAVLLLKDPDRPGELTIAAERPAGVFETDMPFDLHHYSGISWVLTHQQPLVVVNAQTDSRIDQSVARQLGTKSLLDVPLMHKGETLGVLMLNETRKQRRFSQDEIEQVQNLASQAVVAITNAQLYQHALNSEAKYRALFENAADFIWTVDQAGQFTNANHAAETTTGFSKSDIIGVPFTQFVVPEEQEIITRAFDEIYSAGQPLFGLPVKVQTADERILNLELSATPLYESGEVVGLQGIARDVTHRLRMERELIRSEKLAAIGRLAAGVAHEVNNPLAIISSTIQLMMYQWTDDNPDLKFLQQVEEEIQRISRTLKGLMDFARPGSRLAEPLHLNEVVESFIPLVKRDLKMRNVQLNLQLAPDLPLIVIPEDEIKQVLFNLVGNARDAMPEGGQLSIITEFNGRNVRLQVNDTGIGLSPEVEKRLFEPFFSTKGVTGNGLGLAMVHGIIDDCDGTIEAANNADAGCTFTVTLPTANSEKQTADGRQ